MPARLAVVEVGDCVRIGQLRRQLPAGIADDEKDAAGNPQAINVWTVGRRTASMALIGQSYPTVAAWFRLGHPFDYR